MQFANVGNLVRVEASPRLKGTCSSCGAPVIAKCGLINVWHWAHLGSTCPFEREPETEWHRNWKSIFPKEWCEVVVGDLRADVLTPKGIAIEFQNSPISLEDIAKREREYKKMAWVINGQAFEDRFYQYGGRENKYGYAFSKYKWNHARKHIQEMSKPVFIDFDFSEDSLFRIEKSYGRYGYGFKGSKSSLLQALANFYVPWNLIHKEYFKAPTPSAAPTPNPN